MIQPEEEDTNPDDAAFDCKALDPMLPLLLQRCEPKFEIFCRGTLLILSTMLFS